MVPLILVLLAAGTLMIMAHRQNNANERHEKEALEQIARHAQSYQDDVQAEGLAGGLNSYPSQAQTRAIAQRNYSTLVSYAPSDQSLTTLVEFFVAYGEKSFFGSSTSRAYRCYSFHFQQGVEGGTRRTALSLQHCRSF